MFWKLIAGKICKKLRVLISNGREKITLAAKRPTILATIKISAGIMASSINFTMDLATIGLYYQIGVSQDQGVRGILEKGERNLGQLITDIGKQKTRP